jgi:hypothetical protein
VPRLVVAPSAATHPSILRELVGEEREGEKTPREIRVTGEVEHRRPDPRQVSRLQGQVVESPDEGIAPLLCPELRCQRLDGPVVDAELSAGIASRGEQQ